MLRIDVLDSFDEDPRLAYEWHDLLSSSVRPNVFLSWEWLTAWWVAFGTGRALQLVLVRDGDQLIGTAPIYLARRSVVPGVTVRELRFVGDGGPTYPEYLGPIVRQGYLEPVVACLTSHFSAKGRRWDCIRFADVSPDDEATSRVAESLGRRFRTLESTGAVCPYLTLPATHEDLLMKLSSHGRQRERRLLRSARKAFQVELELLEKPEQLDAALADVVRLHQSARARKNEDSPFARPRYFEFHRGLMARFLERGWLRLYFLRFDGTRVAFQYGFLHGTKYYDFQNGFDASFQTYNPGDVILQLVFANLIEGAVSEFDFLRGDHAYKRKFAKQARETRNLLVTRRRGLLYLATLGRSYLSRARHAARQGAGHSG